jgi:hypothetical protein
MVRAKMVGMVGMVAQDVEGMDKEGSEPNATRHDTSWGVGGGKKKFEVLSGGSRPQSEKFDIKSNIPKVKHDGEKCDETENSPRRHRQ